MDSVIVRIHNNVCTLTLNRPDKKNALTGEMYSALTRGILDAQKHEACRVIVIQAEGKDFTAGNDLSDFAGSNEDNLNKTVGFMKALMYCKLPVVALVKGNAVGIGTTMLLHCDVVVCTPDARFSMPFIDLALVPEYASSYLVPKTSGYKNAVKWLLLGESINAETALAQGLVSYLVGENETVSKLENICSVFSSKPKTALIQSKGLLKQDLPLIQDVVDKELTMFIQALHSEPAKEAFDAFLTKRPINTSVYLK